MTFRDGLLNGRRVAFAGEARIAIVDQLRGLGAWVESVPDAAAADEQAARAWVADRLPLMALVFDAAAGFDAGGERGLAAALERAWITARAVATGALIGAGDPGRVLLLAPRPDAGAYADAARAALENLARTLSVEWARFDVTAVAIWPGTETTDQELAALVSFLLSRRRRLLHRLPLCAGHDRRPGPVHISFLASSHRTATDRRNDGVHDACAADLGAVVSSRRIAIQAPRRPVEHRHTFACFGGTCTVIVADSRRPAYAAEWSAVAKRSLLSWHGRFSRFEPASELALFNADPRTEIPVSRMLRRLIEAALSAARETGGLVDATLGVEIGARGIRISLRRRRNRTARGALPGAAAVPRRPERQGRLAPDEARPDRVGRAPHPGHDRRSGGHRQRRVRRSARRSAREL